MCKTGVNWDVLHPELHPEAKRDRSRTLAPPEANRSRAPGSNTSRGGRHGTNTSRSRTPGTKGLAAARRTREKHGTEDGAAGAEEAKDPGHELGKGDV